ncbi:hypothetical protein [Streptomyces viridosporus]|uniref:hypothetical protein n=1 Tax=Streptomyces viridosporus TaxID=67581 RepID=UPI0009BE9E36|nr:hypothetical protein [Streptomyces viridosporus]
MALSLDFALDRGRLVTGEKAASSLAARHALALTQSAIAFHRHGVGTLGGGKRKSPIPCPATRAS